MKKMYVVCFCVVFLTACLSAAQREAIQQAAEISASAAPLLPPPFGLLAGGLATILSGVASIGANKVSNEKFKKKEAVPLLVKLATDHISPIMAAVAAIVPALRLSGLIHMSDAEMSLLMTTVAAPVATKKVMRR